MVARWEASGESAVQFASRIGVHARTLCRWRRLLREAKREQGRPALANIVEVTPARLADNRFEVRLAGGRCVGVPPSFDAPALERLLRVLETVS